MGVTTSSRHILLIVFLLSKYITQGTELHNQEVNLERSLIPTRQSECQAAKRDTNFVLHKRDYGQTESDVMSSRLFEGQLDPNQEVVFLVHGSLNGCGHHHGFIQNTTESYLEAMPNVQVITVCWEISKYKLYARAALDVGYVGGVLARMVDRCVEEYGVPREKITIVGHSLGVPVIVAATRVLKGRLSRIIALDPAFPGFCENRGVSLNSSCADEVVVIHTTSSLGIPYSAGTVDFFVNGGKGPQPGCDFMFESIRCSHTRSYQLYNIMIREREPVFTAIRCDSNKDYTSGKCNGNAQEYMTLNTTARGNYYLTTTPEPPYYVEYY